MGKKQPFVTHLAVATLFAWTCASLAAAQTLPKGMEKGAAVEGISSYKLDNGLLVLLIPDNSKPTVTVNVTYKVGSKNENYGETGMAHLLEHMVFKGTPHHPDIWKTLNDHGAQFNGSTTADRTNYFEVLNSSDENLKWSLDMEADRMVNSYIAKAALDKEMTVVRNEYEMGENNPARVLEQRVDSAAYQWHNYGKDTIGARSDIENVPIERLQAFYHKYYQPDNAMLVVAGKFDTPKTLGWIAEYFGAIPKPTRVIQTFYTREPVQDGEKLVTVRRVGDEQLVMTFYHTPSGTHPDDAPLNILATILGDSPSGRLYKALVDNKKAASVGSETSDSADAGNITFIARLKKDQPIKEVEDTLVNTVEGFAKEPPSQEEFERAKTKILKNLELELANTEQVGVVLSEYQAMGDWRMIFITRDRIRNAKVADVVRVAKEYFKESNRTMGRFIPTDKPDRSEIAASPDISSVLKDYKGEAVQAQGEAFDPSPENIDKRTIKAVLPNGMRLVMLPKKTRGAIVQGMLIARYGTEKSQFGRVTAAQMTGAMLMRGTTTRSRQQIDDEISKLKAHLNVGAGPSAATASLQTTSENLPDLLKLIADVMRHPAFPDNEFETIRQKNLTQIEAARREPQQIAIQEIQRAISQYPRGDVRAARSTDETIQDLKAVTMADVKKFYSDFYGGSHGTLILVGDFDPKQVEKIAGTLFGDWKSPNPYERVPRHYAHVAPVAKTIETPDKANAMFVAGMQLQLSDESPDYPAIELASFLFGGGANNRVLNRLRQKEGWSYGAGAQLAAGNHDDQGRLFAYAILNPQYMPKLEVGFKEELDKALKDGFTADEVAAGKKSWLQQDAMGRSEDGALVQLLASDDFLGRTVTGFQGAIDEKVEQLTPEQVSAAFRKYVKAEDLSIVKAGDFTKKAASSAEPSADGSPKK
ncbi:MAG TPA: pitrilysin family protein [Bryobacteraceae bacterium]|jgi:zinc protease